MGKHARLLVTLPRVLPDRVLDSIRRRLFAMPPAFGALLAANPNPNPGAGTAGNLS